MEPKEFMDMLFSSPEEYRRKVHGRLADTYLSAGKVALIGAAGSLGVLLGLSPLMTPDAFASIMKTFVACYAGWSALGLTSLYVACIMARAKLQPETVWTQLWFLLSSPAMVIVALVALVSMAYDLVGKARRGRS